jgi:hypothetical protein
VDTLRAALRRIMIEAERIRPADVYREITRLAKEALGETP